MTLELNTHRSQLPRSGMALGGIGTGCFEIRQDGGFAQWTIYNNWPQFPGERFTFERKDALFFVLWVRVGLEDPRLILLQIEDGKNVAALAEHEAQYMFPWISGVDHIRYRASVPFADLDFEQEGLPLRIRLRAWSPFIPGNADDSALPAACFDFEVESDTDETVDLQVLMTMRNGVGYDQEGRIYAHRRIQDGDFSAVVMENGQLDPEAATTGTVCMTSLDENSTAYAGWEHPHPYYERLLREYPMPEVDDTDGRNGTDKETGKRKADPRCFATIGRAGTLTERGDRLRHSFVLTWHFPNLYGRPVVDNDPDFSTANPHGHDGWEGHHYATRFEHAEAAARYVTEQRERLLQESTDFHRCFFDSSLPSYVLDQINSQLNTFRTSSWFTQTGLFGIIEGLSPHKPFAGIATTDVAMYGQIATSLLFPALDRVTVDSWRKFQQDSGIVAHSVMCNSQKIPSTEVNGHRLDMPAQFVFQALRAALWNGDADWLEAVWPDAKRALAYVLRERDANGDLLPDMEGIMCSYDNFPMFGVAPFVASQWLAAVALSLKVAEKLDDTDFQEEYRTILIKGSEAFEARTWNGSYFQLYSDPQDSDPRGHEGCLADQLVGEGVARQLGIDDLVDSGKTKTALHSILTLNYRENQGLRNCQWPGDAFLRDIGPDTWVDQANTCWSGVELNLAAQLYHHGMHGEAETIIRNVDERHRRWGLYWDHQEFGGHYFRPMSALGIPNAFLGLSFDGDTLRIAPARELPTGRWCFLLPGGYGTLIKSPGEVRLILRAGSFTGSRIATTVPGALKLEGFGEDWEQNPQQDKTVFTLTSR